MKAVWRQIAGCLIAVAVGFTLRYTVLFGMSRIGRTAVLAPTYLATYIIVVIGLFQLKEPLAVIMKLVREALPERFARFVKLPGLVVPR